MHPSHYVIEKLGEALANAERQIAALEQQVQQLREANDVPAER